MSNNAVIFTSSNHIAYVTLDRPDAGNAIDRHMARELEDICREIGQDNDIHVVLITGAGSVAFCVGSDPEPGERPYSPITAVAGIECPVIAAINGDALGPGLELALSCDIRLVADHARLGLPQISQGLIPLDGGTQRLPRIIGRGKAMEMLLTAETIDAEEALEIGLVSRVFPGEELASEAVSLADSIAGKGPIALRYIKEAVMKGLDMGLEQGLRLEADLYFLLHTTADRTEGIRAFLDKRPPRFKGQ